MDEDYENAALYKKQIVQMQTEQLTAERIQSDFLSKKPLIDMKSLFLMMAESDADFTEAYAKNNLPWDQTNATERVPEIRRQLVA